MRGAKIKHSFLAAGAERASALVQGIKVGLDILRFAPAGADRVTNRAKQQEEELFI